MKTLHVLVLVVVATGVVSGTELAANYREEDIADWYDCSRRHAGNYGHPTNCNKYITCTDAGTAIQRDCGACLPYPSDLCPEDLLRWNNTKRICDWPTITACAVGRPGTIIPTTASSTSSEMTSTVIELEPSTEDPGEDCDPEICKETGYCLQYKFCDPLTRKWVVEECDKGYVWVPNGKSGVHGGACGQWSSLDTKTREEYWEDRDCLACGWWYGECSGTYEYREPHQTNTDKKIIHCDSPLLWDQDTLTCRECQHVKDSKGNKCCNSDNVTNEYTTIQ